MYSVALFRATMATPSFFLVSDGCRGRRITGPFSSISLVIKDPHSTVNVDRRPDPSAEPSTCTWPNASTVVLKERCRDWHCIVILWRVSKGNGGAKSVVLISMVLGSAVVAAVMSQKTGKFRLPQKAVCNVDKIVGLCSSSLEAATTFVHQPAS